MQERAARLGRAAERAHEKRAGGDERGRQVARAEQRLLAIDVGGDAIEQAGALHQPRLQPAPVLGRDGERRDVEFPRPRRLAGIAVDVVGDAVVADHAQRGRFQPLQFLAAQRRQALDQLPPMRPHLAVPPDQLVGGERQRRVALKQR